MSPPADVLIAGAGPTGLVLALCLTLQGVKVRIVDKAAGPGSTSRAMAVQARTLELYRQLGIADQVVAAGRRNPAVNLWVRGTRRARVAFGAAGQRLTPYPFVLVYPQDQHERLLIARLASLGVQVERQVELVAFRQREDGVLATLRGADGHEQACEARFLAGCDGARSPVRHQLGAGFAGGTYEHTFYVADVRASGPAANGEVHVALESSDFVALLAYGEPGQGRLIGALRGERAAGDPALGFEHVSRRAIAGLGLRVEQVNWFSSYRVHHRVTDSYRKDRVFLLGDAAHVHSPVGGQGMNTGIGDAFNLGWKLAAVLAGSAPDALLDSYEAERRAFALQLVATTDRAFSFVTSDGALANLVRTRVVPVVASATFALAPVRERIFRTLSQTLVDYRGSALSRGAAGAVRGGDRLPWVAADGSDNHAPLARIGWQAHVYGEPAADLRAWCEAHDVPLHVFAWRPGHGEAGLVRDAVYVIRPDTYVGLADAAGSAQSVAAYFRDLGIVPASAVQPR